MPCFEQEAVAMEEQKNSSTWTWEQDKAFEDALATHAEDSEEKWVEVAAAVPGKTVEEVKHHYQLLMEDLDAIESGLIPLPASISSPEGSEELADEGSNGKKGGSGQGGRKLDQERRKGIAWTEDEHRLFLLGLEKYGKGDWRSISRHFVITRTPTQVASHAQKYFIRLNSMNKDRRRSSIHDITNVDGDISSSQGPITGEINAPPPSSDKPGKPSQQPSSTSKVGVHGTPTIGQLAVGGSISPAVGTPVSMACGMDAPVSGPAVKGAPVNPATNPMRLTSKK